MFLFSLTLAWGEEFLDKDDEMVEVGSLEGKVL
jgi:hypothetical protein